ncbi:MAG: BatA domain-containing protein, partial [Parvularculaceae bacterium]
MPGLGALSFVSPLILTALIALPAIWLLLRATPPAPQRVKFPPFIILRQLTTVEETPDRTPWWLLLLRLILAGFVIVGLAGPILNAPKASLGGGPIVFVVDDTWAAAAGWRERQSALRAGAEEAALTARPIFLIRTARPPDAASFEPLTGEDARGEADALRPEPYKADRLAVAERLPALDEALARLEGAPDIRWLSDGVAGASDETLASALAERGALSIFIDRQSPQLILRALPQSADGRAYRVERLAADAEWSGAIVATARDGRELARTPVVLERGAKSADVMIDLPLALRNEVASAAIEGVASAGAVQLADARDRRALIGLIAGAETAGDALLAGGHYVRKALEPYAEFIADSLESLLKSDASVIVLDDVGRLRPADEEAL